MAKARIAINGFGRIGRLAARRAMTRADLELVAINDLADNDALTYLFTHDSVQGGYQGEVNLDGGTLQIQWREDGVWMTGPTAHVFDGVWHG